MQDSTKIALTVIISIAVVTVTLGLADFLTRDNSATERHPMESQEMKEAFIDGCMEEIDSRRFCECGYDTILEEYGPQGFVTVSESESLPDEMVEIVLECLYQ